MAYEPADTSFEGWDAEGATFATGYFVMFIGILCALGMVAKLGMKKLTSEKLAMIYVTFAILAALSFGFASIAIHMIATNAEEGRPTSRTAGDEGSEWLFPWTLGLLLNPLASACLLGVGLTEAKKEKVVMPVKIVGLVLAMIEIAICFFDVGMTASVCAYWGLFATIAGIIAVLLEGCKKPLPVVFLISGYVTILIGYMLVVVSPLVCVSHVQTQVFQTPQGPVYSASSQHAHCWMYPDDFNQNAAFHALYALAIPLLGLGVLQKEEEPEFKPLPPPPKRMCGSLCA